MRKKHCIIGMICILCLALALVALLSDGKPSEESLLRLKEAAKDLNAYRITMKLDENDRATTTRLMKVKDMILKQALEEKRAETQRALAREE